MPSFLDQTKESGTYSSSRFVIMSEGTSEFYGNVLEKTRTIVTKLDIYSGREGRGNQQRFRSVSRGGQLCWAVCHQW